MAEVETFVKAGELASQRCIPGKKNKMTKIGGKMAGKLEPTEPECDIVRDTMKACKYMARVKRIRSNDAGVSNEGGGHPGVEVVFEDLDQSDE